jgi:hypothetical protein
VENNFSISSDTRFLNKGLAHVHSQVRNDCLRFELFSLYCSALFYNPESHQATADITALATV